MSIKTKLRLGIGLLFLMILLLSAVGIKNITALKNDTANILADNYNSLEYCENMIAALDLLQQKQDGIPIFEKNMNLQMNNITELGEKEEIGEISGRLDTLKSDPFNVHLHLMIRKNISRIMEANRAAIEHKSEIANETAQEANTWIMLTSILR